MNARAFVRVSLLLSLALPVPAAALAQNVAAQTSDDQEPELRSILDRPAQLDVLDTPLGLALSRLSKASGVTIAFSPSLVTENKRVVSCSCARVTVREALDQLLAGTAFEHSEFKGQIIVFRPVEPVQIRPGVSTVRYASQSGTHDAHGSPLVPVAGALRTRVATREAPLLRQTGTIAGRVTDAATGQGIRWANVQIQGTRRGTMTDTEGGYRLEDVPVGDYTVAASMLGYSSRSQSVAVSPQEITSADFALELSAVRLDEIVVTATGEQRRVELGHVVGTIQADSVVREAPVTRLTDLIGARVAGVQIIPNTGFTGESPRIRIRGLGSISRGRDPLIYVDGVRVESSTAVLMSPYGISGGRINDLNPNEIEAIEIVKGPSAATLYGTDAANGVILVRTKRGQSGGARWNAYFEGGQLRPGVSFESVDSYHSWGTNTATGQPQRCVLLQLAAGACVQDSVTVFNPLTHSETTPIGTGTRSQFGAQVSGGAAELTYFLSADREQETGYLTMPASEVIRIREERGGAQLPSWQLQPNTLERLSLRGSLLANLGENADVRVSSGLVFSEVVIPGNAIFQGAYWGPGYRDVNDGFQAGGRPGETFAVKSAEQVSRYTGSIRVNWRPTDWLNSRVTVGTDLSNVYFDGVQRPGEGPLGAGRAGRRLNSRTNVAQQTFDLGASASARLAPQITSRTSVGVQYNRRHQLFTIATASTLPPGSETVTGAAATTGNEGQVESIVAGGYIEQLLVLKDRLFLTGAIRTDGGSSFGRDLKAAVYPKASASWLISQEPFFPTGRAFQNVRLRVAYGQSGVQPGSTDALDLVSRFTAIVDGTPTTAARLSRLGNPDLKPERQREIEAGIDLDLFENRVTVEITYYDRLSTDALLEDPNAPSVGLGSRWVNVGSVRNWGYEATLGLNLLQTERLGWDITLNGSINHNRLERLGIPAVTALGPPLSQSREGFPLFGRWGRPILSYDDANGNGILEPGEVEVGDTLVYLGPSHPPRQLAASSALSLFNARVRLFSQFDYRGGHVGYDPNEITRCIFFLTCRAVNDPNAPLEEQAAAVARTFGGVEAAAGYHRSASFIRWRELGASYQLPDVLAQRVGASGITITLSGRNLRLWASNAGIDPEVSSVPGNPMVEGQFGSPTAPQTRYWLLRADVRL